ncbi:MAG: hypothetical protein P8X82_15415, partial [Gemmatimonadales bacterium]
WASVSLAQEPQSIRFEHADELRRGSGYMVLADRRIFATMSFLNAVGYDQEQPDTDMHPLRVRVRRELAERLKEYPAKLDRWKAYYAELGYPVWVFVEFALMLSPDHPFRQVYPASDSQYPEAVAKLRDLPELLNEFWTLAGLSSLWDEVKPEYLAEINRYDFDEMARQMSTLWTYLRMPRQDDYVMVNIPNLLDARYTGIGAQFGPYYYQVESAGASSYALNMHEYLHSIVNPLVREHFSIAESKLVEYYEAGKDGRYAQSYQSPMAMTYESLTKALDYRLRVILSADPQTAMGAEARIAEIASGGLAPTAPFYLLLKDRFETGEASFREYIPVLLDELPRYRSGPDQ